jgi:hypothetical protein
MTRLQYSNSGLLRKIRISSKQIFAFCEGKCYDKVFYDSIMKEALVKTNMEYEIIQINTQSNGTGGKMAVIEALNLFTKKNYLMNCIDGKLFKVIFFLDKDADCICDNMINNDHVIYTSLYDVESHLYYEDNFHRALGAALTIPENEVPDVFRNQKELCESIASSWKEWIALCVYSQKYRVNVGCGYSRPSKINGKDLISNLDKKTYNGFCSEIINKRNITEDEFSDQIQKIMLKITNLQTSGFLFSLFKGKWMNSIISKKIQTHINLNGCYSQSIEERISASSLATLNYDGEWVLYYTKKILHVINKSL